MGDGIESSQLKHKMSFLAKGAVGQKQGCGKQDVASYSSKSIQLKASHEKPGILDKSLYFILKAN